MEIKAYDMALAFQRGDEKGFEYFYTTLRPSLLYFALRVLNDRDWAEDAVENAFVKAWETYPTMRHPKAIKSWLYTTVRNNCLLHKKKIAVASRHLPIYSETIETVAPDIYNEIEQAEISSIVYGELHDHIRSLPKECRNIFRRIYIQGKSVTETAKELKISISTVKNQKYRGIEIIKKSFSYNKV